MDGRPHVAVIFPAGTVNSVRSLCEFPSPTNAALFPFRARLRTPPRFFRFLALFKSRENTLYCSTRCRANHLPRFEQPRRLQPIDSVAGAAEVNPESQTAYCL